MFIAVTSAVWKGSEKENGGGTKRTRQAKKDSWIIENDSENIEMVTRRMKPARSRQIRK